MIQDDRILEYPILEQQQFHMLLADSPEVSMHGHDFLEVSYVLEGAMMHCIDQKTSTVRAGEYFIVDYGTRHAYRSLGGAPLMVLNILFYPAFADRALAASRSFSEVANSYLIRWHYQSLEASPTGKTLRDEDGCIRELLEKMQREYAARRTGYLEYIRCLVLELLLLTMRKIGGGTPYGPTSEVVREITAQVRERYREKLSLSALAAQYHYSAAHLSKKFSAEMHMGFAAYVQRIRVEQGCRLLEHTDLSVAAVAEMVGYEDTRFFERTFRRILQVTPREFRRLSR